MIRWDYEKIVKNREHNRRKPVKAFKNGECRKFKSISHAVMMLGVTRFKIIMAIEKGTKINGYELEWD